MSDSRENPVEYPLLGSGIIGLPGMVLVLLKEEDDEGSNCST